MGMGRGGPSSESLQQQGGTKYGGRGRRERWRGRLVCTGVIIIYHSHGIRG